MNFDLFYKGQCFDAYEFYGAHCSEQGVWFRTYAPAAERIAVIGDFNGWKETPMERAYDGKTFECCVPDACPGQMYKYRIYDKTGKAVEHCDPYGFGMELRPNSASVIRELHSFEFYDWDWMLNRTDRKNGPMNIYEVHAGSWHKNPEDAENGWYNYEELADRLIPYVKEHGYNYIEFLPLAEHPSDNSWGYQNTGFYAPTSRYGTPDQLRKLIEQCHKNEIGVLLDFVPVHFAVDGYALEMYDGTALYEYPHPDMGYSEWGSHNFNHCKGEVQSFLSSNANYWLKEFHFDGLRIDALSNLIYWQGNKDRGVNEKAVQFIRSMNGGLKAIHPSCILAAEDSTQYPGVTRPTTEGGLGFDYKWDMGWMNDSLDYMKKTADQRTEHYHKLTFSMMYFYDENFILPLSHDEVVHGKATILQKMSGLYEGKFQQARAFYMYMYAHPGKKLNFMGNEFAQIREWDEDEEQDWFMLRYPLHDSFQVFMKDLSQLYLNNPAFWALDYNTMGFDWVDCDQPEKRIYAFLRHGGDEHVLCLFNFSEKQQDYELRLDYHEELELLLSSDADVYSGSEHYEGETVLTKENGVFRLPMTAYSAKFFKVK